MIGSSSNASILVSARARWRVQRICKLLTAAGLSSTPAFGQPAPPAAEPAQPAAPAPPVPQPAQPAAPAPAPPAAAPGAYPAAQPSPFTGQPSPQPVQAYPQAQGPSPVAAPTADSAAEPPAKRGKVIPLSVFRFGYGAYASGSLDFKGQCAGSCPFALRNGSESVSDTTRALLGFDLMLGPEPVSVGFGFWFTTGTTLESDKLVLSERSIGWEFATPLMLGAVIPVADEIAIRLGAFGGPEFLFADGGSAQGRDGDAYESLCDDLGSQVDQCDVSIATRFSWLYGLQAGPVFRVSRVNTIGAELVVQRVDFELFDVDAEGPGWRAKQTYDYSAWKLWLMVSIGLGK